LRTGASLFCCPLLLDYLLLELPLLRSLSLPDLQSLLLPGQLLLLDLQLVLLLRQTPLFRPMLLLLEKLLRLPLCLALLV
jgi:hypothetical protein